MPVSRQIRLLILDDHALFRQGLARVLSAEEGFTVVAECSNIADALKCLAETRIDLVLLDVDLGGEYGGEFLARARTSGFAGKVLIVTAGVNEGEASRLLRWGTDGIFLKHDSLPTLFERIAKIMAGESVLDPTSVRALLRRIEGDGHESRTPLTDRERDVMRGVLEGLGNKQIADRLRVSETSIKGTLQQLFQKTGVRTRAQLARVAVEKYRNELHMGDPVTSA